MRAHRTIAALVVVACACKKPDVGPDFQVTSEAFRFRVGDPVPGFTPWFNGQTVKLAGARGETLGIQVFHRGGGALTLTVPAAHVTSYDVGRVMVRRESSDMYGAHSHGTGAYPDELALAATPTSDPAYFTIEIPTELAPGHHAGELVVGDKHLPVELKVFAATLPPLPLTVWAEDDVAELHSDVHAPTDRERACIAMFRAHGVLLSPPLPADAYAQRRDVLAGALFVPVDLPSPPGDAVRAWIAQTGDTGQMPFAIPIDEPDAATRPKVRALAQQVRDAGGGPGQFLFAVTDEHRDDYGDLIDLYITLKPRTDDRYQRWTYNGAPPRAGSMVVDTRTPGLRTWGWIAWKYRIPIWYVWDALYWHDRHNHKREPPRELHASEDATSFDNGEDHGNLDGVLALPTPDGCHSTLRLEALRRGLEDRAIIELAAKCKPAETAALVDHYMPRALGDATGSYAAWSADDNDWEVARVLLLDLASCQTGAGEK